MNGCKFLLGQFELALCHRKLSSEASRFPLPADFIGVLQAASHLLHVPCLFNMSVRMIDQDAQTSRKQLRRIRGYGNEVKRIPLIVADKAKLGFEPLDN